MLRVLHDLDWLVKWRGKPEAIHFDTMTPSLQLCGAGVDVQARHPSGISSPLQVVAESVCGADLTGLCAMSIWR